ncbi:hypothetical protein ACWENA_20805 [Streptomyces sp. NPDC004779]
MLENLAALDGGAENRPEGQPDPDSFGHGGHRPWIFGVEDQGHPEAAGPLATGPDPTTGPPRSAPTTGPPRSDPSTGPPRPPAPEEHTPC